MATSALFWRMYNSVAGVADMPMMLERERRGRFGLRALFFIGVFGAPSFCACDDGGSGAPPTQARVRQEVVAELARKVESDYVFEDVAARMAEAVLGKLDAGAYDVSASADELASTLTEDLRAISNDKHLGVLAPGSGSSAASMQERFQNGGIAKIEVLDGNIGYMQLLALVRIEDAREAIVTAFADLHDTSALILDNRENNGGDPRTVAFYMSYLSEGPPYVVNRFHHRGGNRIEEVRTTDVGALSYGNQKPVFVLTSAATFSGGEELAYDIQAQRRGLVIGEVTGGGANPARRVSLGHGFVAQIPNARAVNPITGTNWEGSGVQPDVEAPADQALMEAQRLAVEQLE